MAQLQVEPKKKVNWIAWLLLLLGLIALAVLLLRRHTGSEHVAGNAITDSAVASTGVASQTRDSATSDVNIPAYGDEGWSDVNPNAPTLTYSEIHGKNIAVRGTDRYAVYDLGEDVLFDKDQSAIRKDAAADLEQVAASIRQRFANAPIRLYGFTDAQGSKDLNMQLAEARAKAVKEWLVSNGHLSAARISVEAKGEKDPKASNDSEQGRKQNRRVQIVVRKAA